MGGSQTMEINVGQKDVLIVVTELCERTRENGYC